MLRQPFNRIIIPCINNKNNLLLSGSWGLDFTLFETECLDQRDWNFLGVLQMVLDIVTIHTYLETPFQFDSNRVELLFRVDILITLYFNSDPRTHQSQLHNQMHYCLFMFLWLASELNSKDDSKLFWCKIFSGNSFPYNFPLNWNTFEFVLSKSDSSLHFNCLFCGKDPDFPRVSN